MNKPIYIFLFIISFLNFFDVLNFRVLSVSYMIFFAVSLIWQKRHSISEYLLINSDIEEDITDEDEIYEIAKSVINEMEAKK